MIQTKPLPIIVAIVLATVAVADDTDSNTSAELSEVIVTANKMPSSIQDIPSSISVISDIDIEDKSIKNIDDVIKQIPNLSQSNLFFQRTINFRGINQSAFSLTAPVVINADGVPNNNMLDYDAMLENAERIEVLRGPQGTLYGKSSIGGVINVISKSPKNDWQGSAGLEYGSNNHVQASFNANGALIDDTLFFGIGVVGDKNNGWITNDYDGSDANASREFKLNATLTAKPTEQLTTKLILGARKEKRQLSSGLDPNFSKTRDDIEHANYDMPFYTNRKNFSQALDIQYDFGDITFSSLTTHKHSDIDGVYDVDRTYDKNNARLSNGLVLYQDVDLGEMTQEFRLSSNDADSRVRWVGGLYLEKQDADRTNAFQFYLPPFKNNFEKQYASETNGNTLALFGQADIDVTDDVTLTLGARYQTTNKDIDVATYTYPVGKDASASLPPFTFSIKEDATWHAFLPKIALSYDINDDVTAFVSYSRGELPGGFNFFPRSATSTIKFDAQTADNYEIGIRGDFLDDRLDLGASLFFIDIDDIQLFKTVSRNGVNLTTVSNGGKATSRGIELDAKYRLNDNWAINTALGLTDAQYSRHTNNAYNGNTIQMTPKYTANVGVSYIHPTGYYGRLNLNAQGEVYFDDANQFKQGAWATADVKVGYMNDDFNVYGYVKNITDEAHVESYQAGMVRFNEPRQFGIGMKYSF